MYTLYCILYITIHMTNDKLEYRIELFDTLQLYISRNKHAQTGSQLRKYNAKKINTNP